jgi:hypothetical protein
MKLCTFNKKVKNFSHACNPQIVNDMHIVHLKSEPIKGSLLLKNASELLEQLLSVSSILLCQEKGSINFHCGRTRKSAPPPPVLKSCMNASRGKSGAPLHLNCSFAEQLPSFVMCVQLFPHVERVVVVVV